MLYLRPTPPSKANKKKKKTLISVEFLRTIRDELN